MSAVQLDPIIRIYQANNGFLKGELVCDDKGQLYISFCLSLPLIFIWKITFTFSQPWAFCDKNQKMCISWKFFFFISISRLYINFHMKMNFSLRDVKCIFTFVDIRNSARMWERRMWMNIHRSSVVVRLFLLAHLFQALNENGRFIKGEYVNGSWYLNVSLCLSKPLHGPMISHYCVSYDKI